MIKLSSETHIIRHMELEDFWVEFNAITFGQKLNPELGYTAPFEGSLHNTFAGRKVGNRFSVYRYQPRSREFRTEILAKGEPIKTDKYIEVKVRYEVPLFSVLTFIFLGSLIIFLIWAQQIPPIASILTGLLLFIYILVIRSNLKSIKTLIRKHFERFEYESGKRKYASINNL